MYTAHDLMKEMWLSPDFKNATVQHDLISANSISELHKQVVAATYQRFHIISPRKNRVAPVRRDTGLESHLSEGVPHKSIDVQGKLLSDSLSLSTRTKEVLVEYQGIRLSVPTESVIDRDAHQEHGSVIKFKINSAWPSLSPGFLSVLSSRSFIHSDAAVRVYIHVPKVCHIFLVWKACLRYLEEAHARYYAKVLSDARLYPRSDSIVLQIPQFDWHLIPGLVDQIKELKGFAPEVSSFVKKISPGIGLAFQPEELSRVQNGQSFGRHRCSTLVNSLFRLTATGVDRDECLEEEFGLANIDARKPYRNLNSPNLSFLD